MKIAHLQKVSLQDFPDTISCIIFLAGCSFRCPACYNANILELTAGRVTEQEIFDFLEKRKGKLEGVVITGGEPLINSDILPFLEKIKELGFKIKLDTNGSSPMLLREILEKRIVDYIAMDIKAPREIYDRAAGVNVNLDNIEESMKLLSQFGIDYEFRTTMCPIINDNIQKTKSSGSLNSNEFKIREMNENDIEKIAEWISKIDKNAKFYIQPFVPEPGRLLNPSLEKFSRTKEDVMRKAKEAAEKFLGRVYLRN